MNKRPFLKAILIIFAVLAVVIGGGIATLYIMFPPQKIIALLIPQAEKALGRKVQLDKAGISLFPSLGVTLSGLRVANTERQGFSSEPFVSVEKFTALISVASIVKGYPEITAVIITKPVIRVEVDKNGAFNFDDLAIFANNASKKQEQPGRPQAQPPAPASNRVPALPVPLTLKKFAIESGSIVYDDTKSGNVFEIGQINQNVAFSIDRELKDIKTNGSLVLSQVSVKTKEIRKPLSNLALTVSHDIAADLIAGTVTVNQVRCSLQKLFLNLRGTVANALSPAPELDLALSSDPISIGDALKEVPVELVPFAAKVRASGTAEIGATIKGALAAGKPLPLQGRFALKGVNVKYADLPQAISDLNADIAFTDNSLTVNTLKMLFGSGPIDIKATINNFARPMIDASLSADIKLSEIKSMMQLPAGASLDGRIAADIRAKGAADPSDPGKLDLKGKVDLKNLVVIWSPLIKPAEINGTVSLSSKAVGQNMAVKIGASSLTMNATVANYLSLVLPDKTRKQPRTTVDFKLNSPFLNLDEILLPPKPAAAAAGGTSGGVAGAGVPAEAQVPILAPLPAADMRGLVTSNKIIYKGFTMSNMVTRISIINNIADIIFTTGFSSGQIGNTIHADLTNVKNVKFTNKLTVRSVEVNDLMTRFGNVLKPVTPLNRELAGINKCLFGKINLESSLSSSGGTAEQLTKGVAGNVDVKMAEARLVDAPIAGAVSSSLSKFLKTDKLGGSNVMNIRNLSTIVRIANGKALFDDLKFSSELGDWGAKGSVGFDALMDMAVSTLLNRQISDLIGRVGDAAKGVAKGAAQKALDRFAPNNAQLARLSNQYIDNAAAIPRDNQGRIPLDLKLGGLVSSPKVLSLGFGKVSNSAQPSQPAAQPAPPPPTPQQTVQQTVQEKKEEVKQEAKKVEEEVKQKAAQKLKGLFKR